MPLFSAGSVLLESGALYSSTMQLVPRATNVRQGFSIPRANVMVLNRGKPLENRPVINYVPVEATVDFYETDNSIRTMLGLVNPTGVCAQITDTRSQTATYGVRSLKVLYAPTNSSNYNGELSLVSGVLSSYSLQGSVGSPVQGSFGMQFLDMIGRTNTSARDTSNISPNLVKPENISLTGIQFTGCGLTGITIQSFSFGLGLGRTSVTNIGSKYPTERPLTDVSATLSVQGFFDGINNSLTGLSQFDCGAPSAGTIGLTLAPSCGGGSPTVITMRNPYLNAWNTEGQAGGFSTFSLSLDLPIGPNPLETGDGSVLIFS